MAAKISNYSGTIPINLIIEKGGKNLNIKKQIKYKELIYILSGLYLTVLELHRLEKMFPDIINDIDSQINYLLAILDIEKNKFDMSPVKDIQVNLEISGRDGSFLNIIKKLTYQDWIELVAGLRLPILDYHKLEKIFPEIYTDVENQFDYLLSILEIDVKIFEKLDIKMTA